MVWVVLWHRQICPCWNRVHLLFIVIVIVFVFLLSFGFVVHAETRAISSLNWQPIYYSRCALSLLKRLITTPKVGTFKQGMFSHVFYVYTWFQITSQDCTCCRWSSIYTTYFICFYLPFPSPRLKHWFGCGGLVCFGFSNSAINNGQVSLNPKSPNRS